MNTLTQKSLLSTTKYTVTENGLEISFKSITKKSNEIIPFEEIGSKISIESTYNKTAFYPLMFFLALGLFRVIVSKSFNDSSFVFFVYLIVACLVILYFTSKKILSLGDPGTRNINFHPGKPNKEKVKDFINALLEKRNRILKIKFGSISPQLPYEVQHERILWLSGIGVLSNEEFEQKKEKLNTLFKGKIGFGNDMYLN